MKTFFTGLIVFALYGIGCLLFINSFFRDEVNLLKNAAITENKFVEIIKQQDFDATENLQTTLQKEITQPSQNVSQTNERDSSITDSINTPIIKQYQPLPFSVYSNNGTTVISCDQYASIVKNSEKVIIPYGCINYGNQIKKILARDSSATLTITGYYSSPEIKGLGNKRALYIKDLLGSIGINISRINTIEEVKKIKFSNNKAKGGVLMQLNSKFSNTTTLLSSSSSVVTKTPSVTKNISKVFTSKKFTQGFNAQYFVGNTEFKSHVKKIARHLNSNPSQKIYITISQNTSIDQKQAAYISQVNSLNIQKIMAQMGISRYKIAPVKIVQSEGSNPADNYINISVK